MNIGCVTIYNAREKKSFGGRGYYICESIKKNVDQFDYIGPLKQFKPYSVGFRGLEFYYNKIRKKLYTRNKDRWLFQYYGRNLTKLVNRLPIDIVFSPTSPGSQPIAYLETDKPVVIWTDSTFYGVLDFYPEWMHEKLSNKLINDGLKNEEQALKRSDLIIFKSEWAAQTARDVYGVDPSKLLVVPGGPGFDYDISGSDVKKWIYHRSRKKCKLVFIGGNWERKGGAIAYEVVKRLNQNGVDAELIVIGCKPEIDSRDDHMITAMGNVDKNNRNGSSRFQRIMREAHFFIMPSRAEAMGISNIEANAFGLPAISTDVGGVTSVIRNGVNGKAFHLDDDVDQYCNFIADHFDDYDKYRGLAWSSYIEYRKRLNWKVSGRKVVRAMEALLANKQNIRTKRNNNSELKNYEIMS